MQVINKAWVENDSTGGFKLCVRYVKDTGAENFGCFFKEHKIVPAEFEGLSVADACRKFKSIVYSHIKS